MARDEFFQVFARFRDVFPQTFRSQFETWAARRIGMDKSASRQRLSVTAGRLSEVSETLSNFTPLFRPLGYSPATRPDYPLVGVPH